MQSSRCLQQFPCRCQAAVACSRLVQHLRSPSDTAAACNQAGTTPSTSSAAVTALAMRMRLHLPPATRNTLRSFCCSSTSKPGDAAAAAESNEPASSSQPSSSSSSSKGSESGIISYPSNSVDGWVVNKQPINASMTPQLYGYLLNLTKEHEVLAALREETAGIHGGHMQISPEQGQFMALLVKLMGVKNAIEVGVFTGYSALAVALALPPDGQLVAFDRDAKTMAVAMKHWQLAGVQDKIDARVGPGREGLQQLLQERGTDTFDFAFIDADKGGYQAYFELCLQLVRPGGCIAVDNVLFYGRVVDPTRNDKATGAIRNFNASLATDPRVDFSVVPIGDGVALCRKL